MGASKGYQGHKNWNHWNVSMWIDNDEGLYALAKKYLRAYPRQRKVAATVMLEHLKNVSGITHTPDGAPYSVTTIMAAMRDL